MTPRGEWQVYATTFLVASAVTVLALQLWDVRWDVPFSYYEDALSIAAHFKTVAETGWYESQPLLGAPAGQVFHDFPTADNLHFMVARVLTLFLSWGAAVNVYYVLGFPLAALAAVWFLRRTGVSASLSVALATLYAISPYHFEHGERHLWLSSYYVVPLGLVLVLDAFRGDPLWGGSPRRRGLPGLITGPGARTVLIAAIVGTAQTYYAVFFLLLLATAGIARLIVARDGRRFAGAALAGVATVVVMLANMAPDVLYAREHGSNSAALARGRAEAEIYALKLAQLLLPWPEHRVGPLARLRELYDSTYPLPSESPAIGAVAAAGLVAVFVALVVVALRALRRPVGAPDALAASLAPLAVLTLVGFLFATVGGLSTIISFATPNLRGWNRMAIVLALLCLAAVGLLLDAFLRRIGRGADSLRTRVLAVVVAGALVVVGFVDQTPAGAAAAAHQSAARFDDDAAWIAEVEDLLSAGDLVVQLPYQPFPESIDAGIVSGEALVPYLHSDALRWSSGGIKGRPTADWPGWLETLGGADAARLAVAAGASAVMIDRVVLRAADPALEDDLAAVAGPPSAESADARFALYLLDDLAAEISETVPADEIAEVGSLATDPVVAALGLQFSATPSEGGIDVLTAKATDPTLPLVNDTAAERRVTLSLFLSSTDSSRDSVAVRIGDDVHQVLLVDGHGLLETTAVVPAGGGTLSFPGSGTDLSVSRIRVVDVAVAEYLARVGAAESR